MSVTVKNAYRFRTLESERGWSSNYDFEYFATKEEAMERHKELQPISGIPAPEWYYIASGPIEQMNEYGEWKVA